jgi:hypothetical protein
MWNTPLPAIIFTGSGTIEGDGRSANAVLYDRTDMALMQNTSTVKMRLLSISVSLSVGRNTRQDRGSHLFLGDHFLLLA